jgi:iron complex outermembrane recepter protein
VIVADGNNEDATTSGEFRVFRAFDTGDWSHKLTASVRGREGRRQFGGVQRISLGESTLLRQDERVQPAISLAPDDHDAVRQFTYGLGYGLSHKGAFSIDAAVSRSNYRKSVNFASPAIRDFTVSEQPWTGSLTGSVFLSKRLVIYGGHVRGFEEALIAPDVASNRGEAPPAIRTQQSEIGLRYAVTPKLNLVAGLFSIQKPYYSIDGSRLFRQLGTTVNKGLEMSLAGSIRPGVSMVAGTVLLNPVINGPDVSAGIIGQRPVGSLTRRSILNLDWRLNDGTSPLSLDLAFESLSARTGNISNRLSAPPRETLNLGFRYRFDVSNAKVLLRVQLNNLFNDYGWQVSSSGSFTYSASRNLTAELLIDL